MRWMLPSVLKKGLDQEVTMWPFRSKPKAPAAPKVVYPSWSAQIPLADAPGRDKQLEQMLPQLGPEEFPDNEHNTWTILGTRHFTDYSFLHAEPSPNDVGYDQFVFLLLFTEHKVSSAANYCLEGGQFSLLCTAQDAPKDLPKVISMS